ncbi:hypothetical protein GCM10009087_19160 [Sphingomonas oligophenolica]
MTDRAVQQVSFDGRIGDGACRFPQALRARLQPAFIDTGLSDVAIQGTGSRKWSEPGDRAEDVNRVAAGKTFEQEVSIPGPYRKTRASVRVRGTAAHALSGGPVSAQMMDEGHAARFKLCAVDGVMQNRHR